MKKMKSLMFGAVLIGATSITSCAKTYTCECEITHEQSGQGFSETKTQTETSAFEGKEDNARSACNDSEYNITTYYLGYRNFTHCEFLFELM